MRIKHLLFLILLLVIPIAHSQSFFQEKQQNLMLDLLNISKISFTGNIEDQTTYLSFRLNNIGTNNVNNIVVTIDTDSNIADKVFNIPSLNSGQTMLLAEHWTYTQGGNYNPVILVSYLSTNLNYPQQITIIEINDLPVLTSFDIVEFQITQGDNFNANAVFSDEEDTNLFLGICTTSNCNNCDINIQSGCFAFQNNALSNTNYIFSSAGLPLGNNVLYAKVCDSINQCSSIMSDSLNLVATYNVNGTIIDLFTKLPLNNAEIKIDNNLIAYSNADGYYSFSNVAYSGYQSVRIGVSSYTPRHTWINFQGASGTNIEMNYTIIPLSFKWDLYNVAYKYSSYFPLTVAKNTVHWVNPPIFHVINDSSYVPVNIESNFNNSIINIQTILPTFNPVDAIPTNIVTHQNFNYVGQNGDIIIMWDNSAPGAGWIACGIGNAPIIQSCGIVFKSWVGCDTCAAPGPNNGIYNQEFGTAMGALNEPPQSPNYLSVFTDPLTSTVYSPDDLSCADVYLNRSKVHYQNLSYANNDPEGYDWELRPDLVQQWFSNTPSPFIAENSQNNRKYATIFVKHIWEDGSVTTEWFDYDTMPSVEMRKYRLLFTPEEISEREKEEQSKEFVNAKKVVSFFDSTNSSPKNILFLGDYKIESYDLNNLPSDVKKYFK